LIDWLPLLQLCSVASRGIQPHRIFELGLNLLKLLESLWILNMLKVNHIVADTERLLESEIQEALHDCSIRIIFAFLERDESVKVVLFTFV
jgi:hypothetical protein